MSILVGVLLIYRGLLQLYLFSVWCVYLLFVKDFESNFGGLVVQEFMYMFHQCSDFRKSVHIFQNIYWPVTSEM